jgi:hypothetical protein
MDIAQNIDGRMRSVAALQSTCNTLEKGLTARLKSLDTGRDPEGNKVTEAIFEIFDGPRTKLGKAKIEESGDGGSKAFINNEEKSVVLSRT